MKPNKTTQFILIAIGVAILVLGVLLFLIPPALFPDPGMGFQVLRSMQMGGGFNNFISPDQSDISQNYTEFLTWWSPGQYLVPYFLKLLAHINLGRGIALTVTLASFSGLTGLYCFFRKIGFSQQIAAISLIFIICQLAFFVPYVYYNGGEILLFAFDGWFLYGCIAIKKPGLPLVLFVLLSGWLGFFCKSSFLWMYAAGICCLWISISSHQKKIAEWLKNALWIGLPAVVSLAVIYFSFLSKGRSPASAATGLKVTIETFTFPLASPLLSGFSLDDLFHGLIYNFGRPMFSYPISVTILFITALLSLVIILAIVRKVPNKSYRLFLALFYIVAFLFFSLVYLRQLNISYEARHYRIIGLLIAPGLIYLVTTFKPLCKTIFIVGCLAIASYSITYMVKGFKINNNFAARGVTGIAQPYIDQVSLNRLIKLDNENRNATFVFISDDLGLEITHNRIITMQPINDDLKIDADDYRYDGFAGPLFIVLPESYNGPKEKLIMKSFPGYAGFNLTMLSDKYVLYSAKMKR